MPIEKEKNYQIDNSNVEEKQKGVEIDPALFRQLQIIIERVGEDSKMQIEIGTPGSGSFFDAIGNKIILDPLHVNKDPEQAQFIAAHEGGHRAISRGPHELGLKDGTMQEISSELGFAYGLNCAEDPADNNWIRKKFEGLKPIMSNIYDKWLEKENTPLGVNQPEIRQAMAMLGYVPKFVFFGSEIIRDWHQARFSKGMDPEVEKALEKVKEDFREFFETIPPDTKTEKETIEKARERFLNFYQNIWPEMKRLVEMDINDEKLKQMAEKMMDEIIDQLDKLGKKELEEAMAQGQEAFDKELEKLEKELKDNQKKGEKTEKEMEKLKEKSEKSTGEEKEETEKELNQKQGEQKDNQRRQEELKNQVEQMKQDKEQGNQPIPMNKLTEKLKEKLQEIFNKLPEEEKQRLEQKAREILEKTEDELNKDKEGKLSQDKFESHQEIRQKAQKEKEDKEKQKKEQEEIEKANEELRKKIEKEMNEYDRNYQEVKEIIDGLYQELEKVFIPIRNPQWKKGFPTGGRLDLLKAMQFEADKSKHDEIWERKTIPKKIDYKFLLLVDMSVSMHMNNADNIKETFKAIVVFSEVLNRIGIEFSVIGFTGNFDSNVKTYKTFEEELNREKRKELSNILIEGKGGTPTAEATEFASRALEENKGKDNFLITLTDGQPDSAEDLEAVIKKVKEETNQKLIGLGLGRGTGFVEKFYSAAKGNIRVEDLPRFLSQLLEDMIKNPEKY